LEEAVFWPTMTLPPVRELNPELGPPVVASVHGDASSPMPTPPSLLAAKVRKIVNLRIRRARTVTYQPHQYYPTLRRSLRVVGVNTC
jgi:hypothetical protein